MTFPDQSFDVVYEADVINVVPATLAVSARCDASAASAITSCS